MSESDQLPSVCRVVHFVLPDTSPRRGTHRAAIVTRAAESGWNVNLTVFYDEPDDVHPAVEHVEGNHFLGRVHSVSFDPDTKAPGTWHWPERLQAPLPALPISRPSILNPLPPPYADPVEVTGVSADGVNALPNESTGQPPEADVQGSEAL